MGGGGGGEEEEDMGESGDGELGGCNGYTGRIGIKASLTLTETLMRV